MGGSWGRQAESKPPDANWKMPILVKKENISLKKLNLFNKASQGCSSIEERYGRKKKGKNQRRVEREKKVSLTETAQKGGEKHNSTTKKGIL